MARRSILVMTGRIKDIAIACHGPPVVDAKGARVSYAPPVKLRDINLCDLDQFTSGCPEAAFRTLRREAPVWQHPANAGLPVTEQAPDGEPFWVVCRHADAKAVLRNHQVFSSETGRGARQGGGTTLADMDTELGPSVVLSMMDPPKHTAIRGLVNQGFLSRNLVALEPKIQALTDEILDAIEGQSEVDFLNDVAAQLPLRVICTIGHVPREDWPQMNAWAEAAITYAAHDPQNDEDALVAELSEMGIYAYELVQELREKPNDSIMSQLVRAEIIGEDGQPRCLDDVELIRFFSLLITGGTETTRNAMAGGLFALLKHPEQYRALQQDPDALMSGAIEEILRWTSPVHFNRRTASEDHELRGQPIERGDKVTVWYPSANRDEEVFDEPYRFDIFREKNPHIAFGHGIHHCLGADLARRELRIMLSSFLKRYEGRRVEPVGELRFIRSNRHQGLASMKIRICD
jgi:cytochrome P450